MTPETKFANNFCKAFEKAGWTIINMEMLGDGVPDRSITKKGKTFFLEFKIDYNDFTPAQKVWNKKNGKNITVYCIRKFSKEKDNVVINPWIYSFERSIVK